eukprot:NODE_2058_length_997_cov_70.848101_g1680_i0.p1 GENE.NODE_2058_length_997_cov_70.848101_g1680_i0~~NODE_2058_length_997_cov_70.848101_g1680_i0.p1  ORF type:complete len:321 (-),score=102.33 NODE_2058_length_997_cov_70.848101_g1680_i0:34-921(-)
MKQKRSDVLQALNQERSRLHATKQAAKEFTDQLDSHKNDIKKLCVEQCEAAKARIANNSKLFSEFYTEYYQQLKDLQVGKEKCLKGLAYERNECKKEQVRWEQLEHEIPGAQRLIQIDEKVKQIDEFKVSLEQEDEVIKHKLAELDTAGVDILGNVPGFVHPRTVIGRRLYEHLNEQKAKLESMYNKYRNVPLSEDECSDASIAPSVLAEPGEPFRKLVKRTPQKMKNHLKRLSEEICNNPYGVSIPESNTQDGKQVSDTATPAPTSADYKKAKHVKTSDHGHQKKKKKRDRHAD